MLRASSNAALPAAVVRCPWTLAEVVGLVEAAQAKPRSVAGTASDKQREVIE
jgi:hypothetical protein